MKQSYIPTGNEQISLPLINENNGSIESINFLHMGYKGIIELTGAGEDQPFLSPFILKNGIKVALQGVSWRRDHYWIPVFEGVHGSISIGWTILAPVGERGFAIELRAYNKGQESEELTLGLSGCWGGTIHTINESKPLDGTQHVYPSGWNHSQVFDFRSTVSVLSFAPIFEEAMDVEETEHRGDRVTYSFGRSVRLEPGQSAQVRFYWGVGFEEVGSSTSAKEMLRKGFDRLLKDTGNWLQSRMRFSGDAKLDELFNTNLFFNFFYAGGVTLDTEQFVLVTSRSPRYYVSAAYWDRDSLLWSFPSILLTDSAYAREMLDYVFTVQIRNVGVHSRYIDGTVLEPGFELDELCAPIIALYNYVKHTDDRSIVNENHYARGIDRILRMLDQKKHPDIDLYETFLQPTDDMIVHPYLTYNNMLVHTMLTYLADLLNERKGEAYCRTLLDQAERVKAAIYRNCVFEYEGKQVFAWSVDLQGNWNLYDEPPGSLTLMPHYGFCSDEDSVYRNTVAQIRRPEYAYSFAGCKIADIGCDHAPHPWVLSIANSLLSGRKQHFLDLLPHLKMDNGIACESVDEHTGECVTGEAFATCAGFLCYAMYKAFFEKPAGGTEA